MHILPTARLSLVAIVLAGAAFAQGGPPLRTDDTGTPGAGRWEINVASTTVHGEGPHVVERPLLDLNYGLGESFQLKYEVAWVDVDGEMGLGQSLTGFKWRFHDAIEGGAAFSVYPQVEFAGDDDVVETETSYILPFQATWELGEFGVNAEVGRVFDEGSSDGWIAGLALSHPTTDELELLGEVYGEASSDLDSSNGTLGLGARFDLAEGCRFLGSVGTGLWSVDDERRGVLGYLGIQLQL